jgi:hypothetical protein
MESSEINQNSLLIRLAGEGEYEELASLLRAREIDKATLSEALWQAVNRFQSASEHMQCVEALLSAEAPLTKKNKDVSLLMVAAKLGQIELVESLISAGCSVHERDSDRKTPLLYALESDYGDNVDVVELLIKEGADINRADKEGNTALHRAADRGYLNSLSALLNAGAFINHSNLKHDTPLHIAARGGYDRCVELLLNRGANTRVINKNKKIPADEATLPCKTYFRTDTERLRPQVQSNRRGVRNTNYSSRGTNQGTTYNPRRRWDEETDSNSSRTSYREEQDAVCCAKCRAKLNEVLCQKCVYENHVCETSESLVKDLLRENDALRNDVEQLKASLEREQERNRKTSVIDQNYINLTQSYNAKEANLRNETNKLKSQLAKCRETNEQLEKENLEQKSQIKTLTDELSASKSHRRSALSPLFYTKFIGVRVDKLTRDLGEDISRFTSELDGWQSRTESHYNTLISRLNRCVSPILPGTTLEVFGSFATKLHLPTSDIDLVLCGSSGYSIEILKQIEAEIKSLEGLQSTTIIPTSLIPLLKTSFQINGNTVNVDISIQDSKHRGLECSAMVRRLISAHKPIKSVVMVLKRLFYVCRFNEAFKGGLNSYSLFLMVTSYIQMCASDNPAELLLGFLNFYGNEFNYLSPVVAQDPNYPNSPPYSIVSFVAGTVPQTRGK